MSGIDLERVRRELTEYPGDPDALLELALWVSRHDQAPDFLDPDWLEDLVLLWEQRPRDRTPHRLFSALSGLDPTSDPDRALPIWWRSKTRTEWSEEGLFDNLTGLPLRVRRRADGARMVLVPAGPTLLGPGIVQPRGTHRFEAVGAACHARIDAFYIDEVPVPGDVLERFASGCGLRRDRFTSAPDYVPLNLAEAYAREVGVRLPTEAEAERAARGADGRRFPWGNEFPQLDQFHQNPDFLAPLLAEIHERIEHPLADEIPALLPTLRQGKRSPMINRILSDLIDTTPFGLGAVRCGGSFWCHDVWVQDPWAAAEDENPWRDRPVDPDDGFAVTTLRDQLEEQMGEFDNRHEDAPASTREHTRQRLYAGYSEAELDRVVSRRPHPRQRVVRTLGRAVRYKYVETCLHRAARARDANGYGMVFRGVRGLRGAPDRLPVRGTDRARRVEIPVPTDYPSPRVDAARDEAALYELRGLLLVPGGRPPTGRSRDAGSDPA